MISFSVSAALVSIVWVLAEGLLAYRNGMLTPPQMSAKYPEQRGIPFLAHGGMWGDVIIISPLAGLIVGTHGDDWASVQIITMLATGMVLSGVMHWTYVQTPFPDSLAWKGEGITSAGWLHVGYMGVAFAIIGLLYFCTPSPNLPLVLLTGFLLSIHVVVGTHVPLGVLNEREPMGWCPENLLAPPTYYVFFGVWSTLVAMTMFAIGISGGFFLAMTSVLFALIVWTWYKLIPRVMFVTATAVTAVLFALIVWMWSTLFFPSRLF